MNEFLCYELLINACSIKLVNKRAFIFCDCLFYLVTYHQDNVFVTVVASIQYRAMAERAVDAFYRLSNTREQIQAYVFDGVHL